jgi:subtilase family serine protease
MRVFKATKQAFLGIFLIACGAGVSAQAPDLVTGPLDESQVVTLTGNVHPLARAEFDRGPVAPDTRLDRLFLELRPSPAQQSALDALVEAQHNPSSPLFHQWLTPAEFGARFGVSAHDIARITRWLIAHGFSIDEILSSRRLVVFSGTADQLAETFHTEIHRYDVRGDAHIANSQDPQVPAALAGVIGGIVSLHDFRRASTITSRHALPQMTAGGAHYLVPSDFATIYDLNPVYNAGTSGSGVSIAIVGRSDINLADVASFRSMAGLSANKPQVVRAGADPGLVAGDQDESTLDVEWAGAVAPSATVKFAPAASTSTTDGVDLSAAYVVNHALAPVMSTSYGSCEADMGSSELAFYNALWEQAASQGISSFVSSGDSGASGCDSGADTKGSGPAVNGLCSSPYSTCVGGTEFKEGSNPAAYWSATNSASHGSALSYIPEEVWNESALNGGDGLWASGGGVSQVYTQPAWQQRVSGARAAGGMRAVPDVALSAAAHDGYVIVENGGWWIIAGTSAASPSFAGIAALVVEAEHGKGQGNANASLYSLVEAEIDPFHPTPSGNNSVPGVSGFTASGAAYNLATGLGSVDAARLIESWAGIKLPPPGPNFTLAESATGGAVVAGKSIQVTLAASALAGAPARISLAVTASTGVTVIAPQAISSSGNTVITITPTPAIIGVRTIKFTASDASGSQTISFSLNVTPPPALTIKAAAPTVKLTQGQGASDTFRFLGSASLVGPVALSVSGLPVGVTAAWSANSVALVSGAGSSVLMLTAAPSAKAQTAEISVTAKAGGLTVVDRVAVEIESSSAKAQ